MAADILVAWVTRPSAAMVLTMLDEEILVFHKDGLELPAPSRYGELLENLCIILFIHLNKFSMTRVDIECIYLNMGPISQIIFPL